MDVVMPQLGETVLAGTVAKWHKKVGDPINADESLFEVETDKVTMEIPAPSAGVLMEILIEAGVEVNVGTRIGVIRTAKESAGCAGPAAGPVAATATATTSAAPVAREASAGRPLPRSLPGGPRLSPVVRRLLGENGLSADKIVGHGAQGRITRQDVLAHLSQVAAPHSSLTSAAASATQTLVVPPKMVPATALSAGPDDLVVSLNKIRRLTGAHMARSLATSPHAVQAVEVDFHRVDRARQAIGSTWKANEGYSLTYLPFIARAVCEAIAKFPYVNSTFAEDTLIVHKRVHLGIAVDLQFDGLMVAVVRDAQHRNLRGLAAEMHRLAGAVRAGKVLPDELAGGTYSISNSGSFGTLFSTSIINQPQAAILSTDGVRKRPVVIEEQDGDAIVIRPIGILTQSFDHRAFDGAYSASFLQAVKQVIETRDWLAECA